MDWKEKKVLKEYRDMIEDVLMKDLERDGKVCAHDYSRHRMIASIIETICNIDKMLDKDDDDGSYGRSDEHEHKHELTPEMEKAWASSMENTDGSKGAHWTVEQTTAVAEQNGVRFDHITPTDWMIALNMIYSDYGKTLTEAGIADVDVFAKLAKDFLFDEDAVEPKEKLYYYYKYIVKK